MLAATGALLFVACGQSDGTVAEPAAAPAATSEPLPENLWTEAPAPDAATAAAPATDPPPSDSARATPTTVAAPPAGAADDEPAAPPATDPPVALAVVGGREFDAAVAASSDIETNLLPDLVVDDVRRQTKANLRNVFPADRPVLFWMWAPH